MQRILASSSPFLAELTTLELDVESWCSGPLPAAFWDPLHPEHFRWHLILFVDIIRGDTFLHRSGGVLYGGPCGARWLLIPVLRALHSLLHLPVGRVESHLVPPISLGFYTPYLQDCVDEGLAAVHTSVNTLQATMKHRLNVQDTPLIFQEACLSTDTEAIADYDPVLHAQQIQYEELYM